MNRERSDLKYIKIKKLAVLLYVRTLSGGFTNAIIFLQKWIVKERNEDNGTKNL